MTILHIQCIITMHHGYNLGNQGHYLGNQGYVFVFERNNQTLNNAWLWRNPDLSENKATGLWSSITLIINQPTTFWKLILYSADLNHNLWVVDLFDASVDSIIFSSLENQLKILNCCFFYHFLELKIVHVMWQVWTGCKIKCA